MKGKSMSYVVIGATGQLGTLTVSSLLDRGVAPDQIVAAGRNTEKLAELAQLGVRTRQIDLSDRASLDGLFSAEDTVLLISGSELGQRVAQHGNAIDAAKTAGVRRIVYTSAPKARTSALAVNPEHKATEELIDASGLPATILRNGWYSENYVPAVEQARQTGSLLTSAGEGRVSSASRKDFAEAAAIVLTDSSTSGRVYELSGDYAWTQQELADAISTAIGSEVAVANVTPEEHESVLLGAGLDAQTAGFLVALDGNTRDGLLGETSGDLSALIGRPTTPLVDGLREAVSV
jgi:NAD(P)H dehydrogenase (quinone)